MRLTLERTLDSVGHELVPAWLGSPSAMADLDEMLARVRDSGAAGAGGPGSDQASGG
ncbi:MAG: hypothetical protein R2789_10435 [Microthrixaceae bacterium]